MGHVYCEKGDYETALEYNQKSLDIQEKIGDVKGVANSYTNFGIIYYEMGKYEKAIEYCQKALTISEKVGLPFLQTTAYLFSAKSYLETGGIDACIKALEPGKSSAIQHGLKIHEAIAYSIEGKILNLQHEIEKAMECYRHALDIFEERGQKDGYYYRILYDYAKITNDRALLCEVLQWFEQIGNTHWAAKIKRDLTEMDTTVPSQN
jgi:tetratricopeptide (TPR) repeat protein